MTPLARPSDEPGDDADEPAGEAGRGPPMSGFNLSDWAIRNRSVTIFIMAAVLVAGVSSFYKLGRAEDPPFTFRTMVVKAIWPGATLDETLQQVTERLERTLQEVPNLDDLPQLHARRLHHHLRRLDRQHPGQARCRCLVPGAQEGRRHASYPAAGHARPLLQ